MSFFLRNDFINFLKIRFKDGFILFKIDNNK